MSFVFMFVLYSVLERGVSNRVVDQNLAPEKAQIRIQFSDRLDTDLVPLRSDPDPGNLI